MLKRVYAKIAALRLVPANTLLLLYRSFYYRILNTVILYLLVLVELSIRNYKMLIIMDYE